MALATVANPEFVKEGFHVQGLCISTHENFVATPTFCVLHMFRVEYLVQKHRLEKLTEGME